MLQATAGLVEIDWACFDPESEFPHYRPCDLCEQSAADDAMNGKSISEFRAFYRDVESGIVVCEHCVDKFLAGDLN